MKLAAAVLFTLSTLTISSRAFGQVPETDPTPAPQQSSSSSATISPSPIDRPVSWRLLVPNLLNDQQRIWTFPVRLAHGKDWIPTVAILGTTAGLIALDTKEAHYFRGTTSFNGFNNVFSSTATAIGTVAIPVSLYAVGLLHKDSKMQSTALLAGEAVADSEILATVLKDATKRVRPAGVASGGNYWDSWYDSPGSFVRGNGGFPSGHTIAAFSVATVIARRYGNHRWVPFVAYGAAAAIGFSRLSLSQHFLSDVFIGGAFGYSISRFSVLHQ